MNTSRGNLSAFGLIAPVQLMLGLVIFVPAIYVVWLSFQQSTFGQNAIFVGTDNYAKVLGDPYFWRALLNTVIIVLVVVHVELVVGLGVALLFASGVPLRPIMLAIALAPYAVSEVSAVVMWRFLFDPDVGAASQFLRLLGLPIIEWSVNPSHGLFLIALLSIWLHLPFSFVILSSARLAIPGELYEAARVDGATTWQQFRRITLPLLLPAILVALIFRTLDALRVFDLPYVLTGGQNGTSTLSTIAEEAFATNRIYGLGSAMAVLTFIVVMIVSFSYIRFVGGNIRGLADE
jgi:multiple sugar transport system permease protein